MRRRNYSIRIAAIAAVAVLLLASCGDSGSEIVNGQNDNNSGDNPFLKNHTAEQQLPEGPRLRPEIDHVILAEPDPQEVSLDEQARTVTLTGASAERVRNLGEEDIFAMGNKVFQIASVNQTGDPTVLALKPLQLHEVLYGKWDYDLALGESPQTDGTASQGLEEARAQQELLGCTRPDDAEDTVRGEIANALREAGVETAMKELTLNLRFASDNRFSFKGNMPLGVGDDSNASVQADIEDWCRRNRGSQYCVQEFETIVDLGTNGDMIIDLEPAFLSGFEINPNVTICDRTLRGVPLGSPPVFELAPKVEFIVGANLKVQTPAEWNATGESLRISPAYDLNVPIGYHYMTNMSTNESHHYWAPRGPNANVPDRYKIGITQPGQQAVIEPSGEPAPSGNTEVEAQLYAELKLSFVLKPTATDRVQLVGPSAGVKGGAYGRWRPEEPGNTEETACLDVGVFLNPDISVGLTAEADLAFWKWRYAIIDGGSVWNAMWRLVLWWDQAQDFCWDVDQPPSTEVTLKWQNENADLDLVMSSPGYVNYSSGVDETTGMKHSNDTCPSGLGVCTDQPNSQGYYTESIYVQDESSAPRSGERLYFEVLHEEGEAAEFQLEVKSGGSVVEVRNGQSSESNTPQGIEITVP
jgi:hypothetical protein